MGKLEPLVRFGSSAFGPVHVRAMSTDGVTGDWLPLGTLVRLPEFKELRCPRAVAKPCTLTGTDLFLAASIGATQDQDNAADVPPDFTGTQLSVPHPANGMLYLWLRDDPDTVQTLTLPITPAGAQTPQNTAQQPATAPAAPKTQSTPPASPAVEPNAPASGSAPAPPGKPEI